MKPQWYIKIKWGILDYIDLKKNAFGRRFNRFLECNGRPGRVELGPALLTCPVFQQLQEKVTKMDKAYNDTQEAIKALEKATSELNEVVAVYITPKE